MFDAKERCDVGMAQRGERTGLAVEPGQPGGVEAIIIREHLQRDIARQANVTRAVDLPHTARRKRANDLVGSESGTRCERHADYASERSTVGTGVARVWVERSDPGER